MQRPLANPEGGADVKQTVAGPEDREKTARGNDVRATEEDATETVEGEAVVTEAVTTEAVTTGEGAAPKTAEGRGTTAPDGVTSNGGSGTISIKVRPS